MTGLTIKKLNKRFSNGHQALSNVSLEVGQGELFVVLGPSGSGKSTLLRTIAGLETSTSGEIFIAGNNVTNVVPKDREVAMVFQNYALFPHMSIFDNIGFPMKMSKLPKSDIKEQVRSVANLLNIEDLLKRKPSQLSGGQRQRVAIGRAIVKQPKIFLFDEPLSNLDVLLRRKMREEIKKLQKEIKATMIYVTHDHDEAKFMGNRICILNDGSVLQIGSFSELCVNPANKFVSDFMGD